MMKAFGIVLLTIFLLYAEGKKRKGGGISQTIDSNKGEGKIDIKVPIVPQPKGNFTKKELDKLERAEKVKLLKSPNEILRMFDNFAGVKFNQVYSPDVTVDKFQVSTRFQSSGSAISISSLKCKLRDHVVNFKPIPGFYIFPSAVTVQECSGDGANFMLECVPATTEVKKYVVFKVTHSVQESGMDYREVITHTSCRNDVCRVKAEHCGKFEEYYPDSCMCLCMLLSAKCPDRKAWSQASCDCVCPNHHQTCSIPEKEWSSETCDCQCKKKTCEDSSKKVDPRSCNCVTPEELK